MRRTPEQRAIMAILIGCLISAAIGLAKAVMHLWEVVVG